MARQRLCNRNKHSTFVVLMAFEVGDPAALYGNGPKMGWDKCRVVAIMDNALRIKDGKSEGWWDNVADVFWKIV